MSGDYDSDIVLWSERQADALRRRDSNRIDWDNVAEEIESVGSEQRHAVESLLINIMQHMLQIAAWPEARPVSHWAHEIVGWRLQVRRRLRRAPKLRADIDNADALADLYRDAVGVMYREVDLVPMPPSGVPASCPFTLAELLGEGQ